MPTKETCPVSEGLHLATVVAEHHVEKPNKPDQRPDLEFEYELAKTKARLRRRYHPILDSRSVLRHDIERIVGRPLTDTELRDFESADLIGKQCQVVVTHTSDNAGRLKPQISAVLKAPAPADTPVAQPATGDQPNTTSAATALTPVVGIAVPTQP